MDTAQEWCLQCGTGAPDSLTTRAPTWRSTATVLGATAILAIGAAGAAYAALSKTGGSARQVTATVAQTTAPAAATPATPVTPTKAPGTPTTVKPTLPPVAVKPPKIPLTPAATPKSATTTPSVPTTAPSTTTPTTGATGGATTTTEPKPTPILLDTNAVTTYNPDGYPAASFGDPSLAIDGDTSTGWTARVVPGIAPKMAVGLVMDLRTAQRVSKLALVTSTPGMAIQIFGANGSAAPASITDPAWTQLSRYHVEKKRHVLITLRNSTQAFRFVTLWISGAPAASIGTPEAPGRVSVNEVELFPVK
jgi:hypothetical protein